MRLYLCEKPSQARDIAAVLGVNKRKQGMISGAGIIVTWAIGHLLEAAPPEAYGQQFGAPWREDVLPVIASTLSVGCQKRHRFPVCGGQKVPETGNRSGDCHRCRPGR